METKGNVSLAGFELEPAEKAIVNNIIMNYTDKIKRRCSYDYLELRMKRSKHGKMFLHQIDGKMRVGKNTLSSEAEDYNLFAALAEVMENLLSEIDRRIRKQK